MANKRLTAKEWGREWAARRKVVKGICKECGMPFEGIAKREYCGNKCVARAYRKRHRDDLNKRRMERYYRLKGS